MRKLITLLAASLLSANCVAENYAIVGGTVHTMATQGTIENATVLLKDGKIELITDQQVDISEYTVIDAAGKLVTPGLVGAYTSLGLVEVGFSAGTVDSNSKQTSLSENGAALDVSYALNPDSTLIAISRIEGITTAASGMSRTGQLFNGQGAIISLGSDHDLLMKGGAFVATNVGNSGADTVGGSRASLWVSLENALFEAKFSIGKPLDPSVAWHGESSKADAQALQAIVKGDIPLLIDARRAADIRQVIALKERHTDLNLVLLHATEGWRVANELAAANIPVILSPESNLPYEFDQLGATLANAGRLEAAGVTVAIGMGSHNIRLAKQNAGNSVANGMTWLGGLASLTINPAKIYGIDNQVGSLEQGKRADLVVWTDDPLQVTEDAEHVFINGVQMEMTSRQTKLRDRYLKLSSDKPQRTVRP